MLSIYDGTEVKSSAKVADEVLTRLKGNNAKDSIRKRWLRVVLCLALVISAIGGSVTGTAWVDDGSIAMAQETTHHVTLYGYVRDMGGSPLPGCYVNISDENYTTLKNAYTDRDGCYRLDVPQHEFYYVWVGVNSETDKYMFSCIPQSRKVASGQAHAIRTDFNLRPGGNIIIYAYDEQGNLLRNKDFREVTNWKAFATDVNNLPYYNDFSAVNDDYSAWDWDSAIPAFIVLPQTPYKIHVQCEVPEFGKVMLSADNEGKGYVVGKQGEKLILNFNYEAAKSKLAMLQRDYNLFESQGCDILHSVAKDIELSEEYLKVAEGYLTQDPSPDMRSAARQLNLSLKHSLWTHEQLHLVKAETDIEKYRKGSAKINIVDARGTPLGDCSVCFKQVSHDFLFGANPMGGGSGYDPRCANLMSDAGINSSCITSCWANIEPNVGLFEWGSIDHYQDIQAQLDEGFNLMGSLSLWFYRGGEVGCAFVPQYQDDMTFEELKENVYNHMYTLAGRYSGKIDAWEINEQNLPGANALNLTWKQKLEICEVFAKAVKEANPGAKVLNGSCALPYEFGLAKLEDASANMGGISFPEFLRMLNEERIPVDIIGLEFYYSGVNTDGYPQIGLDLVSASELLDQYSSFGRPIFVKELSAPSAQVPGSSWWHKPWDEQTQAEYVEKFYTIAFSKPLVQAIIWAWGISDADSFIVNGGLLDANLKPKPAYFALKSLVDSWTTTGTGVADSEGEYNFRGFAGNYDVTVTTPDGHSLKTTIHVSEQETSEFTIQFPLDVD